MCISPNATEIRCVVARIFTEYHGSMTPVDEVDERLRIQDGRLVARSYRACGLFAMWLVDVGLLQFYDQHGNMLRTVNLLISFEPARAAA